MEKQRFGGKSGYAQGREGHPARRFHPLSSSPLFRSLINSMTSPYSLRRSPFL